MRKIAVFIIALITALSFAGCAGKKVPETTNNHVLLNYFPEASNAAQAYISKNAKFALLPQPAAQNALNKRGDGKIVIDLQKDYFMTEYPQAVMVVKESLLASSPKFVAEFIKEMQANDEWILDNVTSAVTAIKTVYASTTLNAAALIRSALEGSNIKTVIAKTMKDRVNSYITDIRAIDEKSANVMVDTFYADIDLESTVDGDVGEVKVFAPDGAPALALGKLISENKKFGKTVKYDIVPASEIGGQVGNKNADIAILPVTAASKVAAANGYKLVTVNTHGNLYLLGPSDFEGNIADLRGEVVAMFGMGSVPDLTFKVMLAKNSINYKQHN